jgi:hypothetical protein
MMQKFAFKSIGFPKIGGFACRIFFGKVSSAARRDWQLTTFNIWTIGGDG